jgi:hypothetical protein
LRSPSRTLDFERDSLRKNARKVGCDTAAGDVAHRVHAGTEFAFEQFVQDACVETSWLEQNLTEAA